MPATEHVEVPVTELVEVPATELEVTELVEGSKYRSLFIYFVIRALTAINSFSV